ncbi:MAG: lysoplasmalogenase [Acidimicrobiia bacterium]|nr:lysoplasmalogenase [Acidimicrobiia bacterium]
MTAVAFVVLSLTAVCAVVDWIAVSAGQRVVEYVCKPLVMVGLVIAAFQLDPSSDLARVLLVCGLLLSMLGDVCLMLPADAFVPGLMAFLGAHLFYIAAMVVLGLDVGAVAFGLVLATIVGVMVARRIVSGARAADPALGPPVTLYVVVLSLMAAVAVGTGRPAAIVGGIAFVASDSVLGWTRFVSDIRQGRLVVMVTYHVAQFGLLLALV